MAKKVLIVGGVAGGASAACRLRRLDESAEIIMFERDGYISFANCGLPYHIGETIAERSKLIIQTPQSMYNRFRIDVRNFSYVSAIHPETKTVTVQSAEKGEYEESYDVLVLSPGAAPLKPSLPGLDGSRVYTLRSIMDTDRIKAEVDAKNAKTAVVVGGGFIGMEMAENLRDRGLEVTLVEAMDQVMPPFDKDMAILLAKELHDHGVKLRLGDALAGIEEKDDQAVVSLASGKQLSADMVVLAIGVRPDTGFLQGSGIQLGPKGHIVVDEQLRTNLPDVYAVGDAIQVKDFVTGEDTAIPLAGPANKQGRIVADVIAGLPGSYKATQGSSVVKVFDLTSACTGANEKTLDRLGIPYQVIMSHPFSHASYYPGATQLYCKMLFGPEGQIYGGQIIGREGVEKRVDVLATVMRLGGKVTDLTELELCYAPPYSSAKDPVNFLGYIAENVLTGKSRLATWQQTFRRDPETSILLDVRTVAEYERDHVEGAVNIPVDELRERLDELDKSKTIYEYCMVGIRAHVAYRILAQNGFDVYNITGGWKTYTSLRFDPNQD
ncbi:MAG: FAD-dependent oxidoreductase [Oscillospiraceae bacterium]|nr:FAD-dependent oxidoreductase [Oscillospiraceae bacterium]